VLLFASAFGCGGGSNGSENAPSATATALGTSTPSATSTPTSTATPTSDAVAFAVSARHVVRSDDGGVTWAVAMTTDETVQLSGVALVDREHGWVVGGSDFGFGSALFHTDDGGRTWSDQLPNVRGATGDFGFMDVAFTSPAHGVAVGAERQSVGVFAPPALVIVTDDGGASWRVADIKGPPKPGPLRAVCLNHSGGGIAIGNAYQGGGIALATADGGATWIDIGASHGLYAGSDLTTMTAAACAEPSSFWISGSNIGSYRVGYRPTLLYSPDAGNTWFDRTPALQPGNIRRVLPLSFVNGSEGWTIPSPSSISPPQPSVIEHTSDAGATWLESSLPRGFQALAFRDHVHGVAVGSGESADAPAASIVTFDGGQTWTAGKFPPGVEITVDVALPP
jgi:photosystem II stability/assembly factor-like uncharacterized protein